MFPCLKTLATFRFMCLGSNSYFQQEEKILVISHGNKRGVLTQSVKKLRGTYRRESS
jgi:hypothetical protein